jgi:hypothetical protein
MPPSLSLSLSVSVSVRGIPRRPLRTSSIVPLLYVPLCLSLCLPVAVFPPHLPLPLSLSLSLCVAVSLCVCLASLSGHCVTASVLSLSVCLYLRLSLPRVSRSLA